MEQATELAGLAAHGPQRFLVFPHHLCIGRICRLLRGVECHASFCTAL